MTTSNSSEILSSYSVHQYIISPQNSSRQIPAHTAPKDPPLALDQPVVLSPAFRAVASVVAACSELQQVHLSLESTISVSLIRASLSADGWRRLICRMAS